MKKEEGHRGGTLGDEDEFPPFWLNREADVFSVRTSLAQVCDPAKHFSDPSFGYLLFCNPTQKTETVSELQIYM
jgi:hypothetical protein